MVTFNIRETGNELLRILKNELRLSVECTLTIDVLIDNVLVGDKEGLCASIRMICQWFDSKLLRYSVNIELSGVSNLDESHTVKIDVNGVANGEKATHHFLPINQKDVDALIERFPYPTTIYADSVKVRFSFTMLFFNERSSSVHHSEIPGKKVLLIEDDEMTALVFIAYMEEWGYIVTRVSDAASGVNAAKLRIYNIILIDSNLPKMTSIEAIKEIKELDNKTPIIALTNSTVAKDFTDRFTEANDFLIKPVNEEDLQRILMRYS